MPKKTTKKAEEPKKRPIQKIVAWSFVGISLVLSGWLLISLIRLNILPNRIFIPITIILVALNFIALGLALSKKRASLIISTVLSALLIGAGAFAALKINDTISFLDTNFGQAKATTAYNIVVATNSVYDENSDLSGKEIFTLRDLVADLNKIKTGIKDNTGAVVSFVENLPELISSVKDNNEKIAAINAGSFEAFLIDNEDYQDKLRIIKTIKIDDKKDSETLAGNILDKPFAIYLSGIDTRSGSLPDRSLSDVNIVAAIDPVLKKILLVSIPRDYYVYIHGTAGTGYRDKLTHAGSIGGVELSKATIEDLLGISIPYYMRVNFNFISKLVDAIGGVEVNSDVDYSFKCGDKKECTINPGSNYLMGKCALAFARERHSYASGDRHRGENQEQLISVIMKKVSSSATLLTNYSEILNSLSGTFETNLTTDNITSFVKAQLDNMSPWTTETSNLDGYGGMELTYSYRAQRLYVMHPNEATVTTAKEKLSKFLTVPEPPKEEPVETEE